MQPDLSSIFTVRHRSAQRDAGGRAFRSQLRQVVGIGRICARVLGIALLAACSTTPPPDCAAQKDITEYRQRLSQAAGQSLMARDCSGVSMGQMCHQAMCLEPRIPRIRGSRVWRSRSRQRSRRRRASRSKLSIRQKSIGLLSGLSKSQAATLNTWWGRNVSGKSGRWGRVTLATRSAATVQTVGALPSVLTATGRDTRQQTSARLRAPKERRGAWDSGLWA